MSAVAGHAPIIASDEILSTVEALRHSGTCCEPGRKSIPQITFVGSFESRHEISGYSDDPLYIEVFSSALPVRVALKSQNEDVAS